MKNKIKIILSFLLSLLLANNTFAQEGWFQQTSGTTVDLRSVYFTDNTTGWVVGVEGTILNTTDGGENWYFQTSGTTEGLYSVYFLDNNAGWIVGTNGTILKTTNGGTTWISQSLPTVVWFFGVCFTDSNIGTAVGSFGIIVRTTNGGTVWRSQSSHTQQNKRSVSFTDTYSFSDTNNGWVVGPYGTILKTINGGINWYYQTSGTQEHLRGICFTDTNYGTAVGRNGTILRTEDGGANWYQQISGTTNLLAGVSFTDSLHGTVVGNGGTILRTTDGGGVAIPVELNFFTASTSRGRVLLTWSTATEINNLGFEIERMIKDVADREWITIGFKQGCGTTTEPQEYSYVDDVSSITATSLSYRLKQIDYDGSYEYSEEVLVDNPAPIDYSLKQNYPNPFNPTTTIKYFIPELRFVTLKVYDVLGNEIATLVNEENSAGEYEVEFDGTGLPSGIYFYRLRSGLFVETKKMVLMK
jgi:photosystem II stability/assembly factor-like uncharacterized protein